MNTTETIIENIIKLQELLAQKQSELYIHEDLLLQRLHKKCILSTALCKLADVPYDSYYIEYIISNMLFEELKQRHEPLMCINWTVEGYRIIAHIRYKTENEFHKHQISFDINEYKFNQYVKNTEKEIERLTTIESNKRKSRLEKSDLLWKINLFIKKNPDMINDIKDAVKNIKLS